MPRSYLAINNSYRSDSDESDSDLEDLKKRKIKKITSSPFK